MPHSAGPRAGQRRAETVARGARGWGPAPAPLRPCRWRARVCDIPWSASWCLPSPGFGEPRPGAAASGPGGPAGRQRVCWPSSGTQAAITQAALGSRRSSSHPTRSRGGARGAACARQPARPGRSERPSARARRLRCVRLRVSRRRTCVHARKGTRRAPEAAVTPPGHLCALCFACSVTRGARVSARGVASPRVPGRRRAGAGPPPPRTRLGRRPACASASRRSARPELVRLFPGKGERDGAGARRRREGDPAGSAQARASRDAPCRSPVRKRRARTSPRGPGGSDPGREFTLPRCGASE